MSETQKTVKLKVPANVARIVHPQVARDVKLSAARGAVPLAAPELLLALLFLANAKDEELSATARATVTELPASLLMPVVQGRDTHPQLLDFVARIRFEDVRVMEQLLRNPLVSDETLLFLGTRCQGAILSQLAGNDERLIRLPELAVAIWENPNADRALKFRLGWQEETPKQQEEAAVEEEDEEDFGDIEDLDEEGKTKYQQALEFGVPEKIKMALTGDKEWRALLMKDSNKLVTAAVMKNPRITEGEVLAVANNRSSSDDLIRLISLNREWVKNYEIRKALVLHPRTPLPKAIRYMNTLTEKDIKGLTKSRNVAQVIVNNARRMMMAKEKKQR